jgi:hypothetical protein
MAFQLPAASAKRVADSIRRELQTSGFIGVVAMRVPKSMWALVDGKVVTGREVLQLTSVPDLPAFFALASRLRMRHRTRREIAFIVQVAREAQALGLWLCEDSPQTVVFNCAPTLHRVSMLYPAGLIDYVLARLDGASKDTLSTK